MSASSNLVVTVWLMADLLAFLCVIFSSALCLLPFGVLGQLWYFIVQIPDLCLLPDFDMTQWMTVIHANQISKSLDPHLN